EKASLQGNARATHNLAVLISEGAAGKPDYKRAADLFIAAATMNVADSQYNLGVLYARGLGVPVDLVQSYKWFALAAQQGDSEAGKRRDEVAKALKDGDLATARLAVKAFEPKPLDPAANDEPRPDPAWYGPAAAKTAAGAAADGGDGSAG
ncbi:MAG: sel1 repeat family protein, partial [Rhizobiales bacterium]|nr:sel1 repeat family protein [Hyphomicrobiales bacterium]